MDCNFIKPIECFLSQGTQALELQKIEEAIVFFDKGLDVLGDRYNSSEVEDDTDVKLGLANSFEKKNKLESAANMKQNVLTIRIGIFKKKNNCK